MTVTPTTPARSGMRRWLVPLLALFCLVKALQVWLYPDPYLIGDTEEFILSAMSLEANPYKPMGYSLFLALLRPIAPTPLVLVCIQSALRLAAVVFVLRVLHVRYGLGTRLTLGLGLLLALDPQAIFLDHFLISDSLFISLSLAMLAALLAYLHHPGWRELMALLVLLVLAIPVRFVGVIYPALAVGIALLNPRLARARRMMHGGALTLASGATILAISLHMQASLGVFAPTAFGGWAFYGNTGRLLDFASWTLPPDADPELVAVHRFFASFPPETYAERNTNWHRWHAESPAKQLHAVFLGKPPADEAAWRRGRDFLQAFLPLTEVPTTSAQRLFDRFRVPDREIPYRLDYKPAFVVTNALLRELSMAFLRHDPLAYVTDFYAESVRKLFLPMEEPLAHGRYTTREYPDGSVTRFWPALWPAHETTDWRPRAGDPMARLRWVHAWVVPVEWLLGLIALVAAWRRRGARDTLRSPGALLLGFALVYGLAVAWGHMMEIRYTAPILPFVLVGAALLVRPDLGRRSEAA